MSLRLSYLIWSLPSPIELWFNLLLGGTGLYVSKLSGSLENSSKCVRECHMISAKWEVCLG